MADVEPQLDGRRDLVDILAARTGGADVLDSDFCFRYFDEGGYDEQHADH